MEEIARFLAEHPPFSLLAKEQVQSIASKIQIEYFPAEHNVLIAGGAPAEYLYVICRGSVDLMQQQAQPYRVLDTLGEGDVFGEVSLMHAQPHFVTVRTREETLVYMLSKELFHTLRKDSPAFRYYFTASKVERLHMALNQHRADADPELF
ncbi:MAG: cyclic nucleotide-binding domain-containing protein, partial [Chloroflexaceae bacterium]|nr:cyclic nucleotide-binding domain-containing protein [Chloroflexaceae bacterium]